MPDFNYASKFNKDANFSIVKFGADAPLLETELNEMQEIQREQLRRFLKAHMGDGLYGLGTTTFVAPTFTIANDLAIVDGNLINISSLQINVVEGNSIYLKVKEKEVTHTDVIKKYGNEQETQTITNNLKDIRVNQETSRRLAITYNLSKDTLDSTYTYLKLGTITGGVFVKEVPTITGITTEEKAYWNNKADKSPDADIQNLARTAPLEGLSLTTGTPVTATDTIMSAIGKLQKQSTDDTSALNTHTGNTANPHSVTKAQVGLGNVDNTSDANKPVSTAQQTALNMKANLANPTFTGTVSGITKAMVGLGNVDNTSDANKPVSTAQQTALNLKADITAMDLKAPLASPTFTGTVSGITKSMVGLGNVDNTTDASKPVSTAQQTALNLKADKTEVALKAPLASPTFTGTVSGVSKVMVGLGSVENYGIATQLEAETGTSNLKYMTPLRVKQAMTVAIPTDTNQLTKTDVYTKLQVDAIASGKTDNGHGHAIGDVANLQNALDDKQPNLTGGASTIASENLTASRALVSDISGKVAVSPVTLAQLGYLSTSTSDIQTQLNNKAPLASPTFTGTVGGITKSMVGLGSVDNTPDSAKPVSTPQQTALNLKADLASPSFTGNVTGISKAMVGLANVDNTADSAKPVSTAQQSALNLKANLASPTFTGTVEGITKAMVGLGNVDNTTDLAKPVSTATQTALNLKANLASPSFTGIVSGITKSMVGLGSVDNTADIDKPVSDAVQTALNAKADSSALTLKANLASPTFTGTVGGITKAMVGLSNVDNTSDASKPVSTAQQSALNLKANLASPTFTGTVSGITKAMVGLSAVDNTSDANKPVSTAQQTALNLKANLASPTFTGTVSGITKAMVGLSAVDNTSDANKPVSTAVQNALNLKTPFSTLSATTPATANWYRIASSAVGIGANSALIKIDFIGTGVKGSAMIRPSCHDGVAVGTNINQLGYTSSNLALGLTKVRIVYHTTASGNYAHLEVYNPTALAITYVVDMINSTGWNLVAPNTVGSIPTGYSTEELILDSGIVTNEDVIAKKQLKSLATTGTAPLVVSSTTVVPNLNASLVSGFTVAKSVPSNALFTDTVYTHPSSHPASIITQDASNRFVTDTEKSTWNAKETPAGAQSKVDAHNALKTNPHNVTKSQVGLGNVDNTSDSAKPVSTAQQTALNLKANLASPTFTGTVSGITKAMVGLGNVDNTSDANKPVSTAQQTALNLKADKNVAQMHKLTADNGLAIEGVTNASNVVTTGKYYVSPSTLNIPASVAGVLEVDAAGASFIYQRFTGASARTYFRVSNASGTSWSNWFEFGYADTSIVESGSNVNGRYIKFGDGNMVTWGNITLSSASGGSVWDTWRYGETFGLAFPAEFHTNAPSVSVTMTGASESVAVVSGISTGGFNCYGVRPASQGFAHGSYGIRHIAYGRWKA